MKDAAGAGGVWGALDGAGGGWDGSGGGGVGGGGWSGGGGCWLCVYVCIASSKSIY